MFKLSKPSKSGVTRLKSLLSFWKQSGNKPKELDSMELPKELSYLYSAFFDIRKGCEKIDILNLKAWCDLTGDSFTKFEIDALLQIEAIHNEVING